MTGDFRKHILDFFFTFKLVDLMTNLKHEKHSLKFSFQQIANSPERVDSTRYFRKTSLDSFSKFKFFDLLTHLTQYTLKKI